MPASVPYTTLPTVFEPDHARANVLASSLPSDEKAGVEERSTVPIVAAG